MAPCYTVLFDNIFSLTFFMSYISGDVLVILDLRPDESLFEAGIAREVTILLFWIHTYIHTHICMYISVLTM